VSTRISHWSLLSQINPVHTFHPIFLRSVLILPSNLYIGFPSGPFPSGFTRETYVHSTPMRATYPAHLIFLDLIILIIFGEKYKFPSHLMLMKHVSKQDELDVCLLQFHLFMFPKQVLCHSEYLTGLYPHIRILHTNLLLQT
jgi:hypothetical protein